MRVTAVVVAAAVGAASWLPACSSGSSCDRFTSSAFDPQAWPHPTAEAAVDDFLRSDVARSSGAAGRYEPNRTLPATAGAPERAVFAEVDGPGRLTVQHGGPGWAVSGFETCLD